VVLNLGDFFLRGHLAISGDIFGFYNLGMGMLLTCIRQRPAILPNILQCMAQPFMTKNYPVQNVNSAGYNQVISSFLVNKSISPSSFLSAI
jgi:hypothetical protein